jgi:large subunit ribosomal protein L32
MAVPKRRKSKSRVRTARAHKSLSRPATVYCKQCGAATLPHRVCADCGYYNGQEILKKNKEA